MESNRQFIEHPSLPHAQLAGGTHKKNPKNHIESAKCFLVLCEETPSKLCVRSLLALYLHVSDFSHHLRLAGLASILTLVNPQLFGCLPPQMKK